MSSTTTDKNVPIFLFSQTEFHLSLLLTYGWRSKCHNKTN